MKRSISFVAMSTLMGASAFAQSADYKTTCARGGDARVIEVVAPGAVGESCDVRYARGQDNVSVPYHADNSTAFCLEKARALTQRLASAGFSCSAAPALRADASSGSDYVVEARRAAPQPAATAAPAPRLVANTDNDEDALEEAMNEILTQPEPVAAAEAASSAPTRLAAAPVAAERIAPAANRPQPSPVGRLSGAAPEMRQAATPVTQAAARVEQEEPEEETTAPAPQPAAQAAPAAADKKTAPRAPGDVVRATLHAQAAAWNEGDLEGFMNFYWKSDDLKFVAGGDITRGWSATLKRYRERYGGGAGLGQLAFERLEATMITDDVAVATGRFILLNNGERSSGLFSVIMRRDNGAWRIVHDHTSVDLAAE